MQVNDQNPDVIIIGGGFSGLALLLTLGLHWITFAVVIVATAVMAMSRLLYHGRVDPQLQKGKQRKRIRNTISLHGQFCPEHIR